jgi:hypothetical protein
MISTSSEPHSKLILEGLIVYVWELFHSFHPFVPDVFAYYSQKSPLVGFSIRLISNRSYALTPLYSMKCEKKGVRDKLNEITDFLDLFSKLSACYRKGLKDYLNSHEKSEIIRVILYRFLCSQVQHNFLIFVLSFNFVQK